MEDQAPSKLPSAEQPSLVPKRPLRTEPEALVRILIVEDQESLRTDYCHCIREFETELHESGRRVGFEVADVGCAADAKQNLDRALKTQPFDIMFLDLGIPELPGGYVSVGTGLNLGRIAQEKGCVKQTVVLSGELESLNLASAMELLNSGVKFAEKGLGYIRNAVTEAVRNVLHDAIFETMESWRLEAEPKSADIFAQRIRRLVPYAERSLVYAFGLCFLRCLQDVNRATSAIEGELRERFDFDCESNVTDSLAQQLRAAGYSLKSGRREWAGLQTSLGLSRPASPQQVKIGEIIDDIRDQLGWCLVFRNAILQDLDEEDETVLSFDGEVNAVLSEMILGGLAESPPSRSGACVLQFSTLIEGEYVEVTLHDNLAPLSSDDVAKINDGIGIFAGARFSRAWGLSVMQHVALQGGGRLTVEAGDDGNTIRYRIPRTRNG